MKNSWIFFTLIVLALISCNGQKKEVADVNSTKNIELTREDSLRISQENFTAELMVLEQVKGDLDGDGEKEWVVAHQLDEDGEFGKIRELVIMKNKNNEWTPWFRSKHALLHSDGGGIMGDPYEGIVIQNGVLSTTHSGGSSWKWTETTKYRYQDGAFFMIGFTSEYGKPCEYFLYDDINLSTGEVYYKKEYDICDDWYADSEEEQPQNEIEEFIHDFGDLPRFDASQRKDITITTPKYSATIYL